MKFKTLLLAFMLVGVCSAEEQLENPGQESGQGFFGERERGWFWYEVEPIEEPEELVEELPRASEADVVSSKEVALTPRERLKKQGEDWEDAMAKAILEPNKENYVAYLESTRQIINQASDFAAGAKHVIWGMPQFDRTLNSNTTPLGMIASGEQAKQDQEIELQRIAGENGIIFFFRSDCPYCHKYAPIIKSIADNYGFTVIPVSLDGKGLPEYPYPKQSLEVGKRLNVSTVPALYLVNPTTNTVSTIGFGLTDDGTLKKKIVFSEAQQKEAVQTASVEQSYAQD